MPAQTVILRRFFAVIICLLLAVFLLGWAVFSARVVKTPQQAASPPTAATASPVSPAQPVAAGQQAVSQKATPHASVSSSAAIPAAEDKPWLHETPRPPLAGNLRLAYGWQIHPVFGDWRFHTGIDLDATQGEAVTASLSGSVTVCGEEKHTGLTVIIQSGPRQFIYGSLARTPLKVGQKVTQGETIGYAGQCTAEPYDHLHLSLKIGEDYEDPRKVF